VETLIPLAVVGLVLLAAVIQRLVGLGFGMVMAPFLVVLIGAHEGVMLVNFLSIFAPMLVLPRIWGDIEWRKVVWLGIPALAIMPLAAWVSVSSPAGPLYVVVAALVIVGLVTSMLLTRITFEADGATTRVIAGLGAGAGTVIAGVGGPAMTIYAVVARWPIMSMIATLQPIWIFLSMGSFGIKWAFDDGALPGLPWWAWAGSVVAIIAGIAIGEWLQRRIDEVVVRRLVLILAFIGSIMALITGLRLMFG